MGFGKRIYFLLGIVALCVAISGLMVGRQREKAYLEALETHHDFTLIDDADDFFRLNSLPKDERLLLIFTPDGIPTNTVKAFFDFSLHLSDLAKDKIRVRLVTRTNRDIVANFKRAAHFDERVLLDVGGTVGSAAGAWTMLNPTTQWTYVLTDSQFHIFWRKAAEAPLSYEQIKAELPKR
ncbi:MAG: hypothetical protein ACXWQO_12595 [Bdellovibrionota bacterium]